MKICLCPPSSRHQRSSIGDIVRLAIDNIDVVSAISFQPVSFCGRISKAELEEKRFTQSDFAHAVREQTGLADPYNDWFPLSCVSPFSKLIAALRGETVPTLTPHPHCSMGTYMFVDKNKKATPITRFVDIGAMLQEIDMPPAGRPCSASSCGRRSGLETLRKHYHGTVRLRTPI
jgi:uncharacterized radical SAM superfamily Fe-S cluster-containing enzyme